MSCYMRQMHWLFEALALPYDKEHRKILDAAIRAELALPSEYHCPEVWAAIKALSDDERALLTSGLQARLAG
jgi:hypothetical protein